VQNKTKSSKIGKIKEDDLLTIRKFSEITGINQSKLRYYDDIELFQPAMRGDNGYRYYSALQTTIANCINVVNSLNIPLKKFWDFKEKRTPEQILDLLHNQKTDLDMELFRLQRAYAITHIYSCLIQEGLLADEENIVSRPMAALPIELGPSNDFSSGYFYESYFKFVEKMSERKIDSAFPVGGYYNDINALSKTPGQPDKFFSLTPLGKEIKEAGEYLVGYTRGYYGKLGDLPQRLRAYANEHGITFTGPVYEIYLHDEITVEDPNRYLIQISVPIKAKKTIHKK